MSDKPLTLGMVGDNVAALHQALIKGGFNILEAETKKQFFGQATRMAVGEFQKANGIDPSCEVCMATAAKLGTTLIANDAAIYSQPPIKTLTSQVGAAIYSQPPVRTLTSQVGTAANDNQPPIKALTWQVTTEQRTIQPTSKLKIPTHLSLFAIERSTGHPIARMPFYAEVGVSSFLPMAKPECKLQEVIFISLRELDFAHSRNLGILADRVCDELSGLLAQETIDRLAKDLSSAKPIIRAIFQQVKDLATGKNFDLNDPETLHGLLEKAVRAYAKEHDLPLAEIRDQQGQQIVWAHPLGVLATDHVGYLSFDLTRLPSDVADAVALALDSRRRNPHVPTETTIWVYPMAREEARTDALAQMRFAHDAIVVKLALDMELDPDLCKPKMCDSIANLGIMAMQNPNLTDWRLSPGSFATNPGTLVGADGCELVLPSNIALHEFNFYQVIGVPAADVYLPMDPDAARKVRPGFINEYRLSFVPIGHALGQILYSMPLAPGETVNLAVIDWTRRDDAQRTEQTKLDEQLIHNEHRDRTISETVNAAVKEYQHGSSFMAGIAGSYGAALGTSGMGAAIGLAGSLGGSTSNSSGTRDIAATTVQKLSDNITQSSTAMRELHSTVVVHSTQSEREAIETRTVVNYNHSHSLTILYYEVLRHFRVVTEFVRRRPALLTNIHGGITHFVSPFEINWQVICDNRKLLEAALLDDRYKEGFDIVERRLHRRYVDQARDGKPKVLKLPPEPRTAVAEILRPSGPELKFFEFDMKTGYIHAALVEEGEADQWVKVRATVLWAGVYLVSGANPDDHLDLAHYGAFSFPSSNNSFVGHVPERTVKDADGNDKKSWTVFANEIDMIQIWVALNNTRVSFEHITVTGVDTYGHRHELVNKSYEFGHLVLSNSGHIDLPTLRPQPIPAQLGRTAAELEEDARFLEFNEHLLNNRAHYERALRLGSTPAQRAFELASLGVGGGASLLEKVDSRPLEVLGDYVAYPCIDLTWSKMIMDKIEALKLPEIEPVERLVTLPTRGVFSEAKLGHCNASEEIDNTRFWDWQKSPIPHSAPEIAAIAAGKHTINNLDLKSTPFPQSLVNIVNPPNAPDPTGLASAMNVLATSNLFRDMSGRAEVADLLKKLSDNSVAIAGVAQKAATGGAGTGAAGGGSSTGGASPSVPGGGTNTGSGSGSGSKSPGTSSGAGTRRPTPGTPQTVAEVNDLAVGIRSQLSPAQANPMIDQLYQNVVDQAGAEGLDLRQVQNHYMPPATNPTHPMSNELPAMAGEQILASALERDGLIVFRDWRKNVSSKGIDLVALDLKSGMVWLIDNKAQFSGIGGANALTGGQFNTYKAEIEAFLKDVAPQPRAAEALALLKQNKFIKVVGNGWAGAETRFTRGLFAKGLNVYDVRMGKLFTQQTVWEAAFNTVVKARVVKRLPGTRGTVTLGSMLIAMVVAGGTLFVLRSSEGMKQILGEIAAETALGALLSRLPGGFVAGIFAIGLEGDEPQSVIDRRKTINEIIASLPENNTMSEADLKTAREEIGKALDTPVEIMEPSVPTQPLPAWPPTPSNQDSGGGIGVPLPDLPLGSGSS